MDEPIKDIVNDLATAFHMIGNTLESNSHDSDSIQEMIKITEKLVRQLNDVKLIMLFQK